MTIIDQFQSNTMDLITRLWGINLTNSIVIRQSLVLRSVVLSWIWRMRLTGSIRAYASLPNRTINLWQCDFEDTLLWYRAPRPWRTSGSADVVIVIRIFSFQLVVFIFAALCVAYIRLGIATDMFCCDVNIISFRSARKTEVTRWDGWTVLSFSQNCTASTHFFSLQHIYLELRISAATGARFSKAPETFRTRKAIAKSRTLHLTDLARFLTIELGSWSHSFSSTPPVHILCSVTWSRVACVHDKHVILPVLSSFTVVKYSSEGRLRTKPVKQVKLLKIW